MTRTNPWSTPGESLRCRPAPLAHVPGFTSFIVGVVVGLGLYLGGVAVLDRGVGRRLLLAGSVLWLVGWIAVVPSTAAREDVFYAGAVVVGGFLLGLGVILPRVIGHPPEHPEEDPSSGGGSGQFGEPATYLLAGGAFAGPGGIGLLFGADVLVLAFVITAAATLLVLFLFR